MKPEQLAPGQFATHHCEQLALWAATPESLSASSGVRWDPWEEDGLGPVQGAIYCYEPGCYFALEYLSCYPIKGVLTIYGAIEQGSQVVEAVLQAFGSRSADLRWLAPGLKLTPHSVFREDDNGARFHVGYFPCRTDAEYRAQELASGGHKQAYFVEPAPDAPIGLEFDSTGTSPPVVIHRPN